MSVRHFEAALTMSLAWLTALSLSLAEPASAAPDTSPDAARASLALGLAGLGVTALYCLLAGFVDSRGPRRRAISDGLEPPPDTEAPLIDAKGRGLASAPEMDRRAWPDPLLAHAAREHARALRPPATTQPSPAERLPHAGRADAARGTGLDEAPQTVSSPLLRERESR